MTDTEKLNRIQDIIKREGYADIETMIAKFKTVMLAANEISISDAEENEALRERLKKAEKVCRAADAYVRYGNSPVAIGWDGLLDALGEWKGANDER